MPALPRVLEPELMDTPEEAHGYDTMDHSGVNRVFVGDFLTGYRGGPVLDVGTGTAQIPIELCRQHPTATVQAVDAAAHMLAVGRQNAECAGLAGRIELVLSRAQKLPFPDGHFRAVMSNSIVHHIPEPHAVLAEMVRVLAPGGWLFVRDLLRPADEATLGSLVNQYAGDATPHQRQMFRDSLHAALTLEEVRGLVSSLGLPPGDVMQTTDRHWTWSTRARGA